MINSVTVVGNTTREPELRFTPSGQSVASFGLAENRRRRNANGEWEDAGAHFYDVTCWGQLAENVSSCLAKGTRVIVVGRLQQRSWETDEGERRSKVEINAQAVGPSLEWATVEVEKNERRTPEDEF